MEILIIEDNSELAELLSENLKDLNYNAHCVDSFLKADEYLKSNNPLFMIVDYRLPDLTAEEWFKRKKEKAQITPPFIISTGQGDEQIAVNMMKLGARDYIVKDRFLWERLPSIIKRVKAELDNEQKIKKAEEALRESEQKYKNIVENTRDIVFIIDLKGLFKYVSPEIESYKYSQEELIGKSFIELVHPDDKGKAIDIFNQTIQNNTENTNPFKFKSITKDGKTVWAEEKGKFFKDKNGISVEFHGIVRNISAEKETERINKIISDAQITLLRSIEIDDIYKLISGKTYEIIGKCITGVGIIENSGKTVKVIASHGIKSRINNIINLLGVDPFKATYCIDDMSDEMRDISNSGKLTIINGGLYDILARKVPKVVCDLACKVLNIKNVYGVRLNDIKNENIGVLLIFTHYDISSYINAIEQIVNFSTLAIHRKKSEIELLEAKKRVEESDKMKTSFLQNISHEIRTPINAISGFSRLLSKDGLSKEKINQYSSIIQNSSNQLISVVEDVLTMSSIQNKREKLNIIETDINLIFSDLYLIFIGNAQSKNIEFKYNCSFSDNHLIFTDKTKLTQILTNLLVNALKFTQNGKIEYGYKLKNNHLEFYVSDTGIGISNDVQEKIFDRFIQADKSISTKYGGTGLGLSISKAFVNLLGGKIWVESEENKGSTFLFTIPYDKKEIIESNENIINDINDTKIKILVAEDELINFLLIEEYMSNMKFELLHAKDGQEAVELCKEFNDIKIILMDIKMPRMDGFAATKLIKEFNQNTPIIAHSAYCLQDDIDKYNQIFDAFIPKPINQDELISTINKFL